MTRRLLLLNLLTSALVLSSCSSSEQSEPTAEEAAPHMEPAPDRAEFDPQQLKSRLDAGEDVLLLDVRTEQELVEDGAIEGYLHIPIDELENRISEVPKGQPVAVYCRRGGRASRGAALLREHGYTDVKSGGIEAWKEAGYPVVYPEPNESSEQSESQ